MTARGGGTLPARLQLAADVGMSDEQAARVFGVARSSLRRAFAKAGIPRPTDLQRKLDAASQLVADGASQLDVAATVGVHPDTIREHFPDSGWTRQQVGQHRVALVKAGVRGLGYR